MRDAVVFDNCEHLVGCGGRLGRATDRFVPDVRVLATSRERLRIDGEHVYPVPHFHFEHEASTGLADIRGCDAVRLFVDRASMVLAVVLDQRNKRHGHRQTLSRLDGIPLALELRPPKLQP